MAKLACDSRPARVCGQLHVEQRILRHILVQVVEFIEGENILEIRPDAVGQALRRQHAIDLPRQAFGLGEFTALGRGQQFLVRAAIPQEVAQFAGEAEVG
jgi:hypothetical protein